MENEFSSVLKLAVVVICESDSDMIVVCMGLQYVVVKAYRRDFQFFAGYFCGKGSVSIVEGCRKSLEIFLAECDSS